MISAPEMLQLLQHECETLRRRVPAVDSIAVPRELLETVLEDLHELKSAWDWRENSTSKNNRLMEELRERIDRLKALLAEGREG